MMGYRAPVEGLQRRLEALDEELARLRAAPLPTAAERKKNRANSEASQKVRALEKRLASLEDALVEAGHRELTTQESTVLERNTRLGVALVVFGLLIASLHLVVRSRLHMSWVERTCAIVQEDEGEYVARFVSHGAPMQFSVDGRPRGGVVTCWVPEPPSLDGVGRLGRPTSTTVPFADRLSWAWLGAAASSLFLGLLCMAAVRAEIEKRRRGLVERDDFSSSSD